MLAQKKRISTKLLLSAASLFLILGALTAHYLLEPWGFYWKVSAEETALRMQYVETAEKYLGCTESDGSHQKIIDQYNAHKPLALGYEVQYTDSWCSTFVSSMSIECGFTSIIPTECGCQRHIELFKNIERWQEDENMVPLPGDIIFYDWQQTKPGNATGWSDHVGIVVGTKWPFVKVIEGNKDDCVSYRTILLSDFRIRGYAQPDFASFIQETP